MDVTVLDDWEVSLELEELLQLELEDQVDDDELDQVDEELDQVDVVVGATQVEVVDHFVVEVDAFHVDEEVHWVELEEVVSPPPLPEPKLHDP